MISLKKLFVLNESESLSEVQNMATKYVIDLNRCEELGFKDLNACETVFSDLISISKEALNLLTKLNIVKKR